MLPSNLLQPVPMTSLGGLNCHVYTGGSHEITLVQNRLDQFGRDYTVEADGEKSTIIDAISPSVPERHLMGRVNNLLVRAVGGRDSEWWKVFNVTLSLDFEIKWEDQEIDLEDLKTRLRLLTYFRYKFGPTYVCRLSQLKDGIVNVEMVEKGNSERSLRACLGLPG